MTYVPAKRLCDSGDLREAILTLVEWDLAFCAVHHDLFDAACMAYLETLFPGWHDMDVA